MYILNLLLTFFLIIAGFKLVGLLLRWFIAYKVQKVFGNTFSQQQNRQRQNQQRQQQQNNQNDGNEQRQTGHESQRNTDSSTVDLPKMVKCQTCGLFLSESEAIKKGHKFYCRQEHVK